MSKTFALTMALVLSAMLPVAARADGFAQGMDAYLAGKFKTAAKLLKPVAEAGNARAQYQLGVMYDAGRGVNQNELAAITWYRIAAESEPRAQVALADRLMVGRGIAHDEKAAIDWYRKAAGQADLTALLRLAIAYRDGQGVPKDLVLAHVFASIHVREWGKMDLVERDKLSKELALVLTEKQRAESDALQSSGFGNLNNIPHSSVTGQK
jgi:uncharacterized protein